ncbi:hypothetical protein HDU81_009588 [Chytriomyces hyalinus]|nr:hypothetical protein HDU81_009588 [Chytriomyces hyalinus]
MASWIRSHDAFRNHSKTVLKGIRNLNHATFQTASGASPKVLRDQFLKWHNNMGNHERYEESKLYPFLARRWSIDTLYLTKEHGEMHQKRDRVLALFSKYLNFENNISQHGKPTVTAAAKELELAMEDYDTYVCIHLQEEEEFVVPMVLELEPEEYVEFGELGLTELLRKMDQKDKAMGIKTRGGGKRRASALYVSRFSAVSDSATGSTIPPAPSHPLIPVGGPSVTNEPLLNKESIREASGSSFHKAGIETFPTKESETAKCPNQTIPETAHILRGSHGVGASSNHSLFHEIQFGRKHEAGERARKKHRIGPASIREEIYPLAPATVKSVCHNVQQLVDNDPGCWIWEDPVLIDDFGEDFLF